ncbi:hypothetical protein FQZ97_1064460 [compost metagenome]
MRQRGLGAGDLSGVRIAGSPVERYGASVGMFDVLRDGLLKFGHAGEAVAPDPVLGDIAKKALDHVQPRAVGRG